MLLDLRQDSIHPILCHHVFLIIGIIVIYYLPLIQYLSSLLFPRTFEGVSTFCIVLLHFGLKVNFGELNNVNKEGEILTCMSLQIHGSEKDKQGQLMIGRITAILQLLT
mgnify:CR=1 FL=1